VSSPELPTLLHVLFGATRGGCEENAHAVIQMLPSVKHRVLVLGPAGPMCEDWRNAGAVVEVMPAKYGSRLNVMRTIRQFTHRFPPTAVMLWNGLVRLPFLIRALNPMGIPVCAHGGNPAHTLPYLVDWRFVVLGRLFPPLGPLPVYICCSQYVADSFESSYYLRRFQRVVVPNGVEIPKGPTHVVRPFSPERPFVLGMVARLNRIKDHPTLFRAFAKVRNRFPNTELEIAGAGEEETSLRRLAAELGILQNTRFLGDLSDVYGQMSQWDLFAYATTDREGLGNAVAEAMMFGLPCVVTDVGPTHEFAGDGSAVKLVRHADADALANGICQLIPDDAARGALSSAGRAWAETNYHPQTFATRYANLLGLPLTSSAD
jgi:glycosyltransferase involved in cell wall biosynthesis